MNVMDAIMEAVIEKFSDNTLPNVIGWERIEPYAIDDSARLKKASLGFVDQGQKYNFKASVSDITWRIAIEFYVMANPSEDLRVLVNQARADIYRTAMDDVTWGGLTVDTTPVVDEIFVSRGENYGEGVMLFDIRYRTRTTDIALGL